MSKIRSGRRSADSVEPPTAPAVGDVAPVLAAETVAAARSRDAVLGCVFAVLGAATFSSKAIFIKLAYAEGLGVETLLALRMMLALPVYVAIGMLSLRDRRRRGEGLPPTGLFVQAVLIGALCYWVAMYLDFNGLTLISAQFNVLILMTFPIFVVIFGALFFHQPIQVRAVIAFAVSYVGLAVIFFSKFGSEGQDVVLGAGFILVSAIAFAFYMLFAREVIGRMGPRLFTCVSMAAVSALSIIQFLIFIPVSELSITATAWVYVVLLAVVATILPTFLMNAALQRITAQTNATISMLSPVTTIILATIVLGEILTPRDFAGAALVIGGVGWFTLSRRT